MKAGFCLLPLFFLSSAGQAQNGAPGADDAAYEAGTLRWREDRVAALTGENGWLNLVGLYWLKPGTNTFGAGAGNDIVFPAGKASPLLGNLRLQEGEVWLDAAGEGLISIGEEPVRRTLVFGVTGERPPVLRHRSLRWFIIKRGDRIGVRLRDLEHPAVLGFPGIDYFPIDPAWRLEGRLETASAGRQVPVTNILGQTSLQDSPGSVVFRVGEHTCRLDAVWEEGRLFLIFADATTGDTTYGGGRYLYADPPGPDGVVVLDFNRAINPPCAFTAFATCPVPPPQNVLPLAVTAGEKTFGEH